MQNHHSDTETETAQAAFFLSAIVQPRLETRPTDARPSFRARRAVLSDRTYYRAPAPLSAFELRQHIQSCKWLAGHAYSRWKAFADPLAWAECIGWRQDAEEAGAALSALLAPEEPAAAFFCSDAALALGMPGGRA